MAQEILASMQDYLKEKHEDKKEEVIKKISKYSIL